MAVEVVSRLNETGWGLVMADPREGWLNPSRLESRIAMLHDEIVLKRELLGIEFGE
ncbi:hypothetical protein B0F90DRAFT_1778006 [Multifurca ochricompacta]|uniref:Uncharacterized protein n=1 Tax=Multifurca ochricompacta TaxID=376703 RepID=A0AAD4LVQ3_9AGAM|nr:hypothetical protein B0F90DRAFT_1778006 [Multifurca ochricompacta]